MNNAKDRASLSVTLFGGLVAEAAPSDIPEGSSPLNWDMDYIIGSVFTRDGLKSIFSFTGEAVGPNSGSVATEINIGDDSWANPSNILLNDGQFASVTANTLQNTSEIPATLFNTSSGVGSIAWTNPANATSAALFATASLPTLGNSQWLTAQGIPNPIPTDATIVGIEADFSTLTAGASSLTSLLRPTSAAGTNWANPSGIQANATYATYSLPFSFTPYLRGSAFGFSVPSGATITGIQVQVTGLSTGESLSDGTAVQLFLSGVVRGNQKTSTTPATSAGVVYTFGSSADLWGTTWNPAQINDPTFALGAAFGASGTSSGGHVGFKNYLVTVFYTVSANTTLTTQLLLNGSFVGTQKTLTLPTTLTAEIQGGSSDLWGTTLTPAQVNAALGIRFKATSNNIPSTTSLNKLKLKIYWIEANSNLLRVTGFGYNQLLTSGVTGIKIGVKGYQVGGGSVQVYLLSGGQPVGTPKTFTLPATNSFTNLGDFADLWGFAWDAALVNDTGFGIQLQVVGGSTSYFDYVDITVGNTQILEPFHWVKTYAPSNGQPQTLALDGQGTIWREDVFTNPNVLDDIFEGTSPNLFAKSVTQFDREYICFSDLLAGTDIPRQYDGLTSNFDRISQVGPGAPPAVTFTQNTYPIVGSPNGVTQAAAAGDPSNPGHLDNVEWSAGPNNSSPGNVITVYYRNASLGPDPNIKVGGGVHLSGITSINGQNPNGTYVVTSLGQAVPPGGAATRVYFTVQSIITNNGDVGSGPSGQYQVTLATLTTTVPVPNVTVGSQIALTGVGVGAWDATWTVVNTLNSGQFAVNQTSLTSNTASYSFTLISGTAPTAGELVTVTGCVNGPIVGGTSIFNVVNAPIVSATGSTFTVAITSANVASASETGSAITNGTKFTFDPGLNFIGSVTSPIFGNSGGGNVTTQGNIGAGVRQAVVIFQTRNSFLTAPSIPVTFETTAGANNLVCSQIPIGPPNVVKRIIAFTGVGGGNFFYIPAPVTITGTGQPQVYSSTVVNDNSSTSATFTFTDEVLLAATPIDVQGNNLFNQIELGSCVWNISYADRMFYGLENNKIQNLTNMSFDGGYLPSQNLPLGWSVDPTSGIGGSLLISAVFGNSYYIKNTTGSTQTALGMITQSSYQDFYKVPIIELNKQYGVRITARTTTAPASGALVVDLYSPSFNVQYGVASIPLPTLTSNFQLLMPNLLTTQFTTQVPNDLLLRVYAANIPNNGDVEMDRIEVFDLAEPVLTTEVQASYIINPEAFDGVTGAVGLSSQNDQPCFGAFVQSDLLYFLKESSMYQSQDTPGAEPGGKNGGWGVHEISNKIGTCGPLSYDTGEEWMLTACRPGVYFFNGGEPIKISQEIQPVWDLINWSAKQTVWLKNDVTNRRILIGVPLPTPNPWLPTDPVNVAPTTPNVVLMCSYKEDNTGNELASKGPIHVAFSGKLISFDISRKWSIWHIQSSFADFCKRSDGTAQLLFCSGIANSKIYQQVPGNHNDDGVAINWCYTTYGWIKPEQEALNPLLGNHRKLYNYAAMTMTGDGNIIVKGLPNIINPRYPYTVPGGINLPLPAWLDEADIETPLNVTANRMFMQFSSSDLDAWMQLNKATVTMVEDPWSPIAGGRGV